jgi:cytochrome P450
LWNFAVVVVCNSWQDRTTFVNDPRVGYLPFGYGSRTCIGMTLAQTEAAVFFCQLFRKYRLTQMEGFRPNIIAGISLTTSNGVHVKVSDL